MWYLSSPLISFKARMEHEYLDGCSFQMNQALIWTGRYGYATIRAKLLQTFIAHSKVTCSYLGAIFVGRLCVPSSICRKRSLKSDSCPASWDTRIADIKLCQDVRLSGRGSVMSEDAGWRGPAGRLPLFYRQPRESTIHAPAGGKNAAAHPT